jgi:hypothetical protein
MNTGRMLSDYDHPAIQAKANELTSDKLTLLDKVESLFGFVGGFVYFQIRRNGGKNKGGRYGTLNLESENFSAVALYGSGYVGPQ